jgi:hypothetical protein
MHVLVSCVAYSTYKMEAVHSTEMSVDFFHASQHGLRHHCCDNLKCDTDNQVVLMPFSCGMHKSRDKKICPYLKNWDNASETLPYHLYINYLNVIPNECVFPVHTIIFY